MATQRKIEELDLEQFEKLMQEKLAQFVAEAKNNLDYACKASRGDWFEWFACHVGFM